MAHIEPERVSTGEIEFADHGMVGAGWTKRRQDPDLALTRGAVSETQCLPAV